MIVLNKKIKASSAREGDERLRDRTEARPRMEPFGWREERKAMSSGSGGEQTLRMERSLAMWIRRRKPIPKVDLTGFS